MTQEELVKAQSEATERLNSVLVKQLTPLTPGQARYLLDNADAKIALAQAFGDAELFTAYLREQMGGESVR